MRGRKDSLAESFGIRSCPSEIRQLVLWDRGRFWNTLYLKLRNESELRKLHINSYHMSRAQF